MSDTITLLDDYESNFVATTEDLAAAQSNLTTALVISGQLAEKIDSLSNDLKIIDSGGYGGGSLAALGDSYSCAIDIDNSLAKNKDNITDSLASISTLFLATVETISRMNEMVNSFMDNNLELSDEIMAIYREKGIEGIFETWGTEIAKLGDMAIEKNTKGFFDSVFGSVIEEWGYSGSAATFTYAFLSGGLSGNLGCSLTDFGQDLFKDLLTVGKKSLENADAALPDSLTSRFYNDMGKLSTYLGLNTTKLLVGVAANVTMAFIKEKEFSTSLLVDSAMEGLIMELSELTIKSIAGAIAGETLSLGGNLLVASATALVSYLGIELYGSAKEWYFSFEDGVYGEYKHYTNQEWETILRENGYINVVPGYDINGERVSAFDMALDVYRAGFPEEVSMFLMANAGVKIDDFDQYVNSDTQKLTAYGNAIFDMLSCQNSEGPMKLSLDGLDPSSEDYQYCEQYNAAIDQLWSNINSAQYNCELDIDYNSLLVEIQSVLQNCERLGTGQ